MENAYTVCYDCSEQKCQMSSIRTILAKSCTNCKEGVGGWGGEAKKGTIHNMLHAETQ